MTFAAASATLGQAGAAQEAIISVSAADLPIEGTFSPPADWPVVIHLPAGVTVHKLEFQGETVTVHLSEDVLVGLSESLLGWLADEFRGPFLNSAEIRQVRLLCNGRLLSSYLPPAASYRRTVFPETKSMEDGTLLLTQGLGGTKVTIGPSHGRVWHSQDLYWYYQRGQVCGAGEELQEDLLSIRLMQVLYQYLTQDGATVYVPRQLDQSDCCHPAEGLFWWRMAARYWVQHLGLPSSVWDSGGFYDIDDDIRTRPKYADYMGSDIYISHHTNGFDGIATGTVTFYDYAMEHPEHEADSNRLAWAVQNNVVAAIKTYYDASWYDRGAQDSKGNYGEIRIADEPACLIELAFHDNCTLDGAYLRDSWFRSLGEWAIYKAVCDYFGRTPTWGVYSCEYVSDTIPSEMTAGHSYDVSITYRNRGVLWSDARGFKLGAVDDSDPFAATRHSIAGEVGPGSSCTFNFTMTAPAVAGTYTTDWQMLREGHAWFGPIDSALVRVNVPGPPDLDGDQDVDQEDFGLFQACLTGPLMGPPAPGCENANLEGLDNDVDLYDLAKFLGCMQGPNVIPDPDCAE